MMIKVSLSWLDLKPNIDIHGNQEDYPEYIKRIRKRFSEFDHIPDVVIEQWLWAHHNNYETLRNYAWIDYTDTEFVLSQWTNEMLSKLNVIEDYSDYTKGKERITDINNFCCSEEDLNYWINKGTWKMPPIILDVSTIKEEIPVWSEIKFPFQMIEGHSRLGYLRSMINIEKKGKVKVALDHFVYVMKIKEKQQVQKSTKPQISINDINIPLTEEEFKKIRDKLTNEI